MVLRIDLTIAFLWKLNKRMNIFGTADDTEASVPRIRAHLPPTFQGEISARITGNISR